MLYIGLDEFILAALREDIGTGDITTNSCVPGDAVSRGSFTAKDTGVICGLDVAARVFARLDERVRFTAFCSDGDRVERGFALAGIEGPSRSVLMGERVALNLLQRMSGIATRTAAAVAEVEGTRARIADTRKSTPGLRALEKYAVRTGGGVNHRFNLADGVLIKDNHIKAAGGIAPAVSSARGSVPHTLKIEVETETLSEVAEALEAGADIIMLDNMDTGTMREAIRLIDGRAMTEASGNMDGRDLREVAATGVDIISMGALTHSVRALDISLKFHD